LRSEKLAAAGRLAASISHEINNPLESVTNLLFISLLDPSLSENTRRYLQEAEQELGRVSNIATQTLRFYRQSTKPTSADLGFLVDSVLRLLAARLRNSEITVVRDYRTDEQVLCFEGELRQVFTNLIGNAVDALAPGGCVKVRTKKVMLRGSGERAIQVTVADNGSGIPPDTVSNIFEPFYSTKGARGTGLGLWVSKEIVMKHRGRIKVRSRLGKGTVFTVVIPEKVDQEPLTVSA
jgi:signal transduction histidine kinase